MNHTFLPPSPRVTKLYTTRLKVSTKESLEVPKWIYFSFMNCLTSCENNLP